MFQPQGNRGRQVLVVENEPVTALALSAELRDHGLEAAGPFASRADALAWLGENQPDYAILDVGLDDGTSFDVARELYGRGIPFVFFPGAEDLEWLTGSEWRDIPWVGKPSATVHLVRILQGLAARSRHPDSELVMAA